MRCQHGLLRCQHGVTPCWYRRIPRNLHWTRHEHGASGGGTTEYCVVSAVHPPISGSVRQKHGKVADGTRCQRGHPRWHYGHSRKHDGSGSNSAAAPRCQHGYPRRVAAADSVAVLGWGQGGTGPSKSCPGPPKFLIGSIVHCFY